MLSAFLPTLLTWLQQFGYPILWLCTCIAAIGVPLPMSLVLLAAGAFAALGEFNFFILILITVTASITGDSLSYLLGRSIGTPLLDWVAQQKSMQLFTSQRLQKAHDYFERRGGWAIFLSRFLFSGLGGIINLLAGIERYPYKRFLFADISGEVLGAVIPLSLGYIFGASWEAVGDFLGAISGLAITTLITLILLIQLIKILRGLNREKTSTPVKAKVIHKEVVTRSILLPRQIILREDAPPGPLIP